MLGMNFSNLQTKDKGLRLVNVKHHIAETRNSETPKLEMKYDFCLSLGGSCAAAIQLRRRGKRTAALPFDWLMTHEARSFDCQVQVVCGEHEWLEKDSVKRITPPYQGPGLGPFQYRDEGTGFEFLHDFHGDIGEQQRLYNDVVAVYRRRFDRLRAWLANAERVLLVLDSPLKFSNERLEALRLLWVARFPNVEFDLFAVLYSQGVEEQHDEGHLIVRRLRRAKHVYDNEATAPVWDFLDGVTLSGRMGHESNVAPPIPFSYCLIRLVFLASRKILRRAGYAASLE